MRSKKEEGQVDRNMSSSKIVVIVYLSHVQSMIVMSVIALPLRVGRGLYMQNFMHSRGER